MIIAKVKHVFFKKIFIYLKYSKHFPAVLVCILKNVWKNFGESMTQVRPFYFSGT